MKRLFVLFVMSCLTFSVTTSSSSVFAATSQSVGHSIGKGIGYTATGLVCLVTAPVLLPMAAIGATIKATKKYKVGQKMKAAVVGAGQGVKKGAVMAGRGVVSTSKMVGSGLMKGTKVVASGTVSAVKTVGSSTASAAKTSYRAMASVTKKSAQAVKNFGKGLGKGIRSGFRLMRY